MSYLVVGAGFTGATIAERLASVLGAEVNVVEQRSRVGGSAEDYRTDDGLLVQKYGPHVFHTNAERVWKYVQRFGEWRPIQYKVAADFGGQHVPLPLDFRAVRFAEPSVAERRIQSLTECYGLGSRIGIWQLRRDHPEFAEWAIDHVFRGYNEKHWGIALEEMPQSVLARLPFVVGEQDGYFTDKYQAVPVNGYTALIERMLDHPKIKLTLNWKVYPGLAESTRDWQGVVWTGSPDAFFGEEGALPYRSVAFRLFRGGPEQTRLNLASPYATLTYPGPHEHTRSTEMLHINGGPEPSVFAGGSALVSDFPRAYEPGKNDPFYPIPLDANIRRAQEYDALRPQNVWFAGRLGSYQYLNMDQAVGQALALFERVRAS